VLDRRLDWSGTRVGVTGGTGFLGFQLVKQLLAHNARVRIVALPPRPGHPVHNLGGVEGYYGDVRDPDLVRAALADCDVIFHTAGSVAAWGPALTVMREIHERGTSNILAAARPGARIVHTSSIVAVGGTPNGQVLDEDSPFTVDDLAIDYVHAKRAAERLALAAAAKGRDVVVVNPGYLIGPEDYEGSVMGRLCVRAWKGRLPVAPPGGFNLVDVRDVAQGHLLAAQHGRAGVRYILGGENHSSRSLLALLADLAGLAPRAIPTLPPWLMKTLAVVAEARGRLTSREPYPSFQHARLNRLFWFVRSDRARRELGYECRPVRQSLLEAYHWHSARKSLSLRGITRLWMRAA
jgi:dihydroflavonol-4-reductase